MAKAKWEQATANNCGLGNEVRTDDGIVGTLVKLPKRGPVTIKTAEGDVKTELAKLEVNTAKAVSLSDVPADEQKPKATPVRERKPTIVRVVQGRTYEYQNLGGGKLDNGDEVATALRGKTLDEVYAIAANRLGVDEKRLRATYESNNPGRQRMTLGNLMRSHAKATGAGLSYVPPFLQAEAKAAAKVEREKKAAEAKAEREAKAAAAKAEREKKAQERADMAAAKAAEKKAATEAKPAAPAKKTVRKAQAEASATA